MVLYRTCREQIPNWGFKGIRVFTADTVKLEEKLLQKVGHKL